jgi:hypothetical protein
MLKVPVIDHWWQTETGWTIAGNPMGLGLLPVKYGSPAVPMPGYDVQVLDDAGHPVAAGTLGNIVVKLPLPPGCLPTLWNAETDSAMPISPSSPATTRLPTPASSTRTATCSSWRARTTSSMSPVTGCRPVAWRKLSRVIRTWLNAR